MPEYRLSALLIIELCLSTIACLLTLRLLPFRILRKNLHLWHFHDISFLSVHGLIVLGLLMLMVEIIVRIVVVLDPDKYAQGTLDLRYNRILNPVFEYGSIPIMTLSSYITCLQSLFKAKKTIGFNHSGHSLMQQSKQERNRRCLFYSIHIVMFLLFFGQLWAMMTPDLIHYPGQSGQYFRIVTLYAFAITGGITSGIVEYEILNRTIQRTLIMAETSSKEKSMFAAFLKERVTNRERFKYYVFSSSAGILGLLALIFYGLGEFAFPEDRNSYFHLGMSTSVFAIVMGVHHTKLLYNCIQRVKKTRIHISPTQMNESILMNAFSSMTPSEAHEHLDDTMGHTQLATKVQSHYTRTAVFSPDTISLAE